MSPRGRRLVIALTIIVVIWVLLTVLRFTVVPIDDVARLPEEETLRIGFSQSVDSLNPYVGLNDPSFFFYSLVYDCLTTVDEDMNPTGNLAVSWWKVPLTDSAMVASGEPYGSVWEYNLTQNAVWHDGVAFSADDVLFNMNINLQDYDLVWAYQPYTYHMRMVEKTDNYTIRIHFWDRATGDPMPVSWGDFIPIHILPKHLLELLPGGIAYICMNWTGAFSNSTSPYMPIVGTGPWIASSSTASDWTEGDHIILKRNSNYHMKADKPGSPDIAADKLAMRFFDDMTAMVLALKNGELDAAKYSPAAYDSIRDAVISGYFKNVTYFSGPSCAQGYVYLSCAMNTSGGDNDARLDPAVRRAMAMATNKSKIVNDVFLGLAQAGSTVIPPANLDWHYEPSPAETISYNLTAASELLNSSGYVDIDSDGIKECTVSSLAVQMGWVDEGTELDFVMPVFANEDSSGEDIAKYLKSEWGKIGVVANWTIFEYRYIASLCPIQEDISVSWWTMLDPDPEYILFTQSDAAIGGWSDTRFSNASYNENFTKSVSTLDPGARKGFVNACQRILYSECPYIVLAYPYSNYAWRNDTFLGWGDWAAHPGRSLDACWGANPLFFDLSPVHRTYAESESSSQSKALNIVIGAAAVVTVVAVYFVWRAWKVATPPKT